jgi:hypothetical protein
MASDESEDTLDERLETILRRAENFRDLLKDGEEVTIAYQDGEVHVEESYRSKFERQHPKLFGRMLAIEAQMNTGWLPHFVALVAAATFIVGLPAGWWGWAIGETGVGALDRWWFYLALPAALLYVAHLGCRRWERHVYGQHRQELLDLIRIAGLDRDVLLVMLRDETELDDVVHQLKLDRAPNQ